MATRSGRECALRSDVYTTGDLGVLPALEPALNAAMVLDKDTTVRGAEPTQTAAADYVLACVNDQDIHNLDSA